MFTIPEDYSIKLPANTDEYSNAIADEYDQMYSERREKAINSNKSKLTNYKQIAIWLLGSLCIITLLTVIMQYVKKKHNI